MRPQTIVLPSHSRCSTTAGNTGTYSESIARNHLLGRTNKIKHPYATKRLASSRLHPGPTRTWLIYYPGLYRISPRCSTNVKLIIKCTDILESRDSVKCALRPLYYPAIHGGRPPLALQAHIRNRSHEIIFSGGQVKSNIRMQRNV